MEEGHSLELLMAQTVLSCPCFLARDFNLHHPAWQTSAQASSRAEPFLQWTQNQNLALTLPPDSPTRGLNTIDLAWANNAALHLGVHTEIATDFPPLADHEPIMSSIQWGHPDVHWDHSPLRLQTLNDKQFSVILEQERASVDKLAYTTLLHPDPQGLDKLTNHITQSLTTALEAST